MKIKISCNGDSILKGYPLAASASATYQLNALLQALGDGNTYIVENIALENRMMVEIDTVFAATTATLYDPTADRNILLLEGCGNDIHFGYGLTAATSSFDSVVAKALAVGWTEIYFWDVIQRGFAGGSTQQEQTDLLDAWRLNAIAVNNHVLAHPDVTYINVSGLAPALDASIDPWFSQGASVRSEYHDWAHLTELMLGDVAVFLGQSMGLLAEQTTTTTAAPTTTTTTTTAAPTPVSPRLNYSAGGPLRCKVGANIIQIGFGGNGPIRIMTNGGVKVLL